MTAATQVFDTTELLEMILYELPTKDLLFAQRISKQAKAVIDNSTKLQQALFFKPIQAGPLKWCYTHKGATFNDGNSYPVFIGPVLQNPLLAPVFSILRRIKSKAPFHVKREIEREMLDGTHGNGMKHPSWASPNASWRKMIPSQPPIQSCFFILVERNNRRRPVKISKNVFQMGSIVRELDAKVRCVTRWDTCFIILEDGSFYRGRQFQTNRDVEKLIEFYKKAKSYLDRFDYGTGDGEENRIENGVQSEDDDNHD